MSVFINESQKLDVGVRKCWGKGKVQKNATKFCLNLAQSELTWISSQIISTQFDFSFVFLSSLFMVINTRHKKN